MLSLASPHAVTPLDGLGAVETMEIDFGRPLDARVIHMSSGWGKDDRHHVAAPHSAIDFPQPTGTKIWAIQSGTVTRAVTDPSGDAGRYVVIQHDKGWISRYLHMSKVLVSVGQRVARGQVIGKVGNTGNSAGPHLHLDLWLDPELLPDLERDVGRPVGGYPTTMAGRTAVPGEPWVPADSYDPGVVRRARAHNIPLYWDRHRPATERAEEASTWAGLAGVLAVVGVGAAAVAAVKLTATVLASRARHGAPRITTG